MSAPGPWSDDSSAPFVASGSCGATSTWSSPWSPWASPPSVRDCSTPSTRSQLDGRGRVAHLLRQEAGHLHGHRRGGDGRRRRHRLPPVPGLGAGCSTALTILVLLAVYVVGHKSRGAQAWFQFGSYQLEPSEFAKIGADRRPGAPYCAAFKGRLPRRGLVVLVLVLSAVPFALIYKQPDLGTALVLAVVFAGAADRWAASGPCTSALLGADRRGRRGRRAPLRGAQELPAHRLTSFCQHARPAQPEASGLGGRDRRSTTGPSPRSPSATAASTARGSARAPRPTSGTSPSSRPTSSSPPSASRSAWSGRRLLLLLFVIMVWRTWRAATLARDLVGTLICVGVLAMLVFQVFENIGMTMGIMPVAGHPAALHELRRLGHDRHLRRRRPGAQRPHAPVRLIGRSPPTLHRGWPGRGRAGYTEQGHDVAVAPDRTAACPRAEAGPLHRVRGRGAVARSPAPGGWRGCCIYPDAYEIGLPNQGLQILYELINERADALAERSYAPWTDMEAELRRRRAPAVLRRQPPRRPATSTCWRSTCRPSWSTPTCSTASTWPASRSGPSSAARSTRWSSPAATAPSTPSRWPTSSTSSSSATARRWSARSPTSSRDWKASGRTEGSRQRRAAGPGLGPGRLRPVHVRRGLRRARAWWRSPPATPTCPARVEKRTITDLAAWPYPKQQLVPMTEVVHDRLNVEIFRGCTRGCRFCQAGMITRPVRERPAAQVRQMVSDGLRRTGYDEVSLTSLSSADFSGIDEVVGGHHQRPGLQRPGVGQPAQPAGRRLHRRHRQPRSRRCAAPG